MPDSKEFDELVADGFASYRLRISGLVEAPRDFSLADLKAMAKQKQITTQFCIQGWSGVAEWGGVRMRDILDQVKPTPEARYAVFYSLAHGADGGRYYDVHRLENMRQELTILAYEMNGTPVSVLHGAPLRLRCERELGFKMVKWVAAIEFVADFADLGARRTGGRPAAGRLLPRRVHAARRCLATSLLIWRLIVSAAPTGQRKLGARPDQLARPASDAGLTVLTPQVAGPCTAFHKFVTLCDGTFGTSVLP